MKNRTLFQNAILIMLPIVLAVDVIMLVVGYRNAKTNAYDHYINVVTKSAATAVSTAEDFDLSVPAQAQRCSEKLGELCDDLDIQYMYVLSIDEASLRETYLALGFHKDTPEEIVRSRRIGDVVTGLVNEQQIAAAHGATEDTVVHESNRFGDTLICYLPLGDGGRIVGAEKAVTSVTAKVRQDYNFIAALTLVLTVLVTLDFAMILQVTVSRPARKISRRMKQFVSDRGDSPEPLEVKSSREFTEMAQSFNSMAEEIERYIGDIDALNREKHRHEAEMHIAKMIQTGLLPPPEHACAAAALHAFIQPAKEVGGDLYDYYTHENGDVSLAVADVSGKGVSAALFMSRAITLLRMLRKMELSPAKTLETFNDALAEFNPKGLFITAFIARYDAASGTLTYANAGHNPPYVISDRLITLDGARSMAAGVFAGVPYEETTVTLQPGDVLYLFTDGVNEAQNAAGDLFSTEALERVLAAFAGTEKTDVLRTVLARMEAFTGAAEQSDDITMLTMQVRAAREYRLEVPAEAAQLPRINAMIDGAAGLPAQTAYTLKLAAEELFVNICSYAYENGGGTVQICLRVSDETVLTFIDGGAPFDPTQDVLRIEEYDHDRAVGGLGRFIAFELAKSYAYERKDGRNILTLTFGLSAPEA